LTSRAMVRTNGTATARRNNSRRVILLKSYRPTRLFAVDGHVFDVHCAGTLDDPVRVAARSLPVPRFKPARGCPVSKLSRAQGLVASRGPRSYGQLVENRLPGLVDPLLFVGLGVLVPAVSSELEAKGPAACASIDRRKPEAAAVHAQRALALR